jgi:sRNA-binding protein
MPSDAASFDAPDTVPDQLRDIPPEGPDEEPPAESPAESGPTTTDQAPAAATELSPAANLANAPELSPAGNLTNAPELSPAGNLVNAPELSPAACGARLAELFPALFTAPGAPGPAKPIKLRIHADIQARAPGVFTKRMLGIFFSRYTTSNAYLKALSIAPHRFDLDGQPAGEIAAEHRQAATDELARRHALAAERRAAQRPAPRRDATAAEGEPAPGAKRETRPERQPGRRPDAAPRPAAQPLRPRRNDGPRPERGSGAPPSPQSPPSAWPPRHPQRPTQAREAAPPATLPADPAQRERAMLLRSYESSPLSKANFCALKGMTEAALDAALAQAQAERGERKPPSNSAPPRSGGGR